MLGLVELNSEPVAPPGLIGTHALNHGLRLLEDSLASPVATFRRSFGA